MSSRAPFLLVLVLALVGGLLAWRLLGGAGDGGAPGTDEPRPVSFPVQEAPSSGAGIGATGGEERLRDPLAADEPAPEEPAGRQVDAQPFDEELPTELLVDPFAVQYEGVSLTELREVHTRLKERLKNEVEPAYQQLLARGEFTAYPYEYDEGGNLKPAWETVPPNVQRYFERPFQNDATQEWQVVRLPVEEFRHVYDLRKEVGWVGKRIGRRGSGQY